MKRSILIFLVIFLQTALAVSAGLAAVYSANNGAVPEDTDVYGISIGGLNEEEALNKLNKSASKSFDDLTITFKYNDKVEYSFSSTSIDLQPDFKATVDNAYGSNILKRLTYLLSASFSNRSRELIPVFRYNEDMLGERIQEFATLLYNEPQNAKILVNGEKVEKIPEKTGLMLNINEAAIKIREHLNKSSNFMIDFSSAGGYVVETINPSVTLEDLKGIDSIVAEYSIQIPGNVENESVALASNAVNGQIISPSSSAISTNGTLFSFNDSLEEAGILKRENDKGYNLTASALYAAVLEAGMDAAQILRTRNETYTDYIEPGLDVKIFGDSIDFKFANTSSGKIMIQSEADGDKLSVRILGNREDNDKTNRIETKIVQVFEPSIINVEDLALSLGEKEIVNEGKEGLKVKVFRNTYSNNIKIDEEYLYTDIYESIESVVKIGPNTGWTGDTNK